MENEKLFIKCHRFGCTKFSFACAHYDRYRTCRRYCSSLRQIMREIDNFKESVQLFYNRAIPDGYIVLPSRFCCKGLPLRDFQCPSCNFAARSDRGLRTHITRSHKEERGDKSSGTKTVK